MWPKEIKAGREILDGGRFAFNLRHDSLGDLGRIVLQTSQQGGSHVSYEVIDLPDGRAEERKLVLESLTKIVTTAFQKARR
ncbi:hypothetical protein [Pseudomonas sp.]|uniref:hypothetical protein n=1 Tax=Pseudomonas sp. TaxID=306 RepID=UPI0032676DC5